MSLRLSLGLALRLALGAQSDAGSSGVCNTEPVRDSVLLQTDRASSINSAVPIVPEQEASSERIASEVEWAHPEIDLVQESIQSQRSAPSSAEREHFNLVKAERSRGGTCPDGSYFPPNNGEFKWDCRLSRAARGWSQRMANENFFAHKKGNSNSCQRTEAQGFPKQKGCGENLAAGPASPQGAIDELKKSNDHCKNMFEPKYNKLGVGFASNSGSTWKNYWTDSFGEWHQAPDESCIGGYPAPSPAPGCADIDTMNCKTYRDQGYCNISPTVKAQCKETCNIDGCGSRAPSPPAPPPPPPPPAYSPPTSCADKDGGCAYYKSMDYCDSSAHIREQCQKTCGQCQSAGQCADTYGSCAYYQQRGYCNTDSIKRQCRKTCGLC